MNKTDKQTLKDLRVQIDNLDKSMLKLIKKRFLLTAKIGEIKARNLTPIFDKKREQEIKLSIRRFCSENNLNAGKITGVFEKILEITRGKNR
ncbi:chorismate mutase [Candidatus Woesearchaeota archaeon]|nr:chorismate mutase [Candidatus Woesearchaeota archaeon]